MKASLNKFINGLGTGTLIGALLYGFFLIGSGKTDAQPAEIKFPWYRNLDVYTRLDCQQTNTAAIWVVTFEQLSGVAVDLEIEPGGECPP